MSNSSSEEHNSENDGWQGEPTANTGSESLWKHSTVQSPEMMKLEPHTELTSGTP
jgi:hypothetical protein